MTRRMNAPGNRRGISRAVLSGAAALTPTTIANCGLWLIGDAGLTVSGTVVTWNDQSGNARNFSGPDAAHLPVASTIGGVPVLNFPGVSANSTYSFITGPSLSTFTAGHGFVVANVGVDTLGHGMCQLGTATAGGEEFMPYSNGLVYDNFGSTTRQTTGVAITAGAQVLEFISTSTEWTFNVNGAQKFTTPTNTVGFGTVGTMLGCTTSGPAANSPSVTYPFNNKIGAVIIYSRKLTSAEAAQVVSYLRGKFTI